MDISAAISLTPGRFGSDNRRACGASLENGAGRPLSNRGEDHQVGRFQQPGRRCVPQNRDVTVSSIARSSARRAVLSRRRRAQRARDDKWVVGGESSSKMWTSRSWFLNDDMVPTWTISASSAPMSIDCHLTRSSSSVRKTRKRDRRK